MKRKALSFSLVFLFVLGLFMVSGRSPVTASQTPDLDRTFTIYYEACGGEGSMEPQTVHFGEAFKIKDSTFTKPVSIQVGWKLQRKQDFKFYVDGLGFMEEYEVPMSGHSSVLPLQFEFKNGVDASWLEGAEEANEFTLLAVWEFYQEPFDIANAKASSIVPQYYTGKPLYPRLWLYYDGNELYNKIDYVLSYTDNVELGTATITVKGKYNYKGTRTEHFRIIPAPLSRATVTLSEDTFTYDGTAKKPVPTVEYASRTLVEGTDYTLEYASNVNAGNANVRIIGMGNYTGTAYKSFRINPIDLSEADISSIPDQSYTGGSRKPEPTVRLGDKTLVLGQDYNLSYTNNIHVGEASATISGINNYTGKKTVNFNILTSDINDAEITVGDRTFTGEPLTPAPKVRIDGVLLRRDRDYTLTYRDNISAGTAVVTITGIGECTGFVEKTFTIKPKSIKNAVVSKSPDVTYRGTAYEPSPEVTLGETLLKAGTDYTLRYKKNTNAGKATLIIQGAGNYKGKITRTFTIKPRSIKKVKISGIQTMTYTGKKVTQKSLVLKDGDRKLKYKKDYTLKYKNAKEAGRATIIFIGKGNYTGKVKKTFLIRPARTKITKLSSSTGGKVKCKWKISRSAFGYEIQYSTKKSFKGAERVDVPFRTTGHLELSGLKKGRTYYFRVRPYTIVSGKRVSAVWSKTAKVKIR